jgi:hypothetical protein
MPFSSAVNHFKPSVTGQTRLVSPRRVFWVRDAIAGKPRAFASTFVYRWNFF